MSKIKAVDFANYVDKQKKRLVQHCMEHGREASNSDSLDTVVSKELTFQNENINTNWKVEFIDIDGSMLAPNQFVENGGSVTLPSTTPSFDSEYLEFDEWRADGDINNVTKDLYVLPQYKTKYDEDTQQRPTFLICYFGTGYLSPTFSFYGYSTTNFVNAYIDFGDGSTAEQITANTKAHTYASEGLYVVKIWGDKYTIGGHSNGGLFTNTTYSSVCLENAYLGENAKLRDKSFYGCKSLKNIVLPKTLTEIPNSSFSNCESLITFIVPKNTTSLLDGGGKSSLKYVIMPEVACSMGTSGGGFFGSSQVERVVLDNMSFGSATGTSTYSFSIPYKLKELVLPSTFHRLSLSFSVNLRKLDLSNVDYVNLALSGGNCDIIFNTEGTGVISTNANGTLYVENLVIPKRIVMSTSYQGTQLIINCKNFEYHGTTPVTTNGVIYRAENVVLETDYFSIIGSGVSTSAMMQNPLRTISLTNDWNYDIKLGGCVTDASLIGVCKCLKDKTGETALTLTLYKASYWGRMNTLYVDANGDEAEPTDTGAMTLLEYVQSKNWTVTFV